MNDRRAALSDQERQQLDKGQHETVAAQLLERSRPELAGWVLEEIWDFPGAFDAYRSASERLDALRVAIESGREDLVDTAVADLESAPEPSTIDQAIALLRKKRRPMAVARLLAIGNEHPHARAEALARGGDLLEAAKVLAAADDPKAGLQLLMGDDGQPTGGKALALAAELAWDLGDAAGVARFAQLAVRHGEDTAEVRTLLARALGSLGHDLAAQMVLEGQQKPAKGRGLPGRYRITGRGHSGIVGAAYVGFDRVTLQEVEIHLLLSDLPDGGPVDPSVGTALAQFAIQAEAGSELGHPAVRPVLRIEPEAGLLVMPQAEGPSLRSLIRPPGMADQLPRARGLIAFLAEGLATAHQHGLVHGWLVPSQIICDAAGRPMLGPFGAGGLSGLAATHTGSLEEMMMVTAPELAQAGEPTVAGDIYSVGVLLWSLVTGRLSPPPTTGAPRNESTIPELALARALTAADPRDRPSISRILGQVRRPVATVRELEARPGPMPNVAVGREAPTELEVGLTVEVSPTWSDDLLAALCRSANPWLQPVLNREGRRVVLAPWPAGARTLGEEADLDWATVLPSDAMEFEPELREAIVSRIRPQSLVCTPSGQWMIAVDDLLGH